MAKKVRTLPPRLAELRERDPATFREACRRGGRNAAKKKAQQKAAMLANKEQQQIDVNETIALMRMEQDLREAVAIAYERRDHLLPDP